MVQWQLFPLVFNPFSIFDQDFFAALTFTCRFYLCCLPSSAFSADICISISESFTGFAYPQLFIHDISHFVEQFILLFQF